jgi:hypothetical protein
MGQAMRRFRIIILSLAVCVLTSATVVLSVNGYFINFVLDLQGLIMNRFSPAITIGLDQSLEKRLILKVL